MKLSPAYAALLLGVLLVAPILLADHPPISHVTPEAIQMWEVDGDLNVTIICPVDSIVLIEFTIHKETANSYRTKRGLDSTKIALEELQKVILEYKAKKGDK